MPSRLSKPVPTPVAAALGLVPTALDKVRRLPGKAAQIPVLAVSNALNALETAKKEYDDLADRGERLVARLRGGSFDGREDHLEDLVRGTPLATPYDADSVEDAPEDAVAKVSELLDRAADRKPTASPEPVDTAASADVVETVETVAAAVATPEVTAHDDLPLPDYDHMTLGSLRGRLRSLTLVELVQVRDYEKAHAHRLPVVTLLDNRIAKLATDPSAAPSPGGGEVVNPVPDATGKVTATTPPTKGAPRTKVRTT
ncbi:MAG: hypothetical protein JWM02_1257 [Frankiales bacterium]|nr:hypothetical protein [Frankiales bacterium]